MNYSNSGNIEEPLLIKTFYNISVNRLEGILRAEIGKFKKELYFKNGMLVAGRSNILKETLGRVLFEAGLINQSDYETSLNEVIQNKERQGAVLQKRGLLPININDALKLQLRMRFVYTFTMAGGKFHFREMTLPESLLSSLSLPLFPLVLEGVKTYLPKDIILDFINKNLNKRCIKGHYNYEPSLFQLTQEELNILTKLASNKTLKEIITAFLANNQIRSMIFLFFALEYVMFDNNQAHMQAKQELSQEHKKLLEQLKDKTENLKEKNFYECLGVNQQANKALIKKAYFMLAKEYHPDHYYEYPPEVRDIAAEIFTIITNAYETLFSEEEHAKYDNYLKTGKKNTDDNEADAILRAELQFQKGEVLLKTNDAKGAHDNFKWAVELNPNEGEYIAYLGWSIFKLDPDSEQARSKAIDYIKRGLQLNKEQDSGHYFLGRILKVKGDEGKAMEEFAMAYSLNPSNIDALREIRAYELSKKNQTGVFKKLFKQ
ncbi:MAG: DnaJ domain-containing protein [Deltaproteobacteria bacterium]|nr:DnaJ domain-containing protein [Deltaproteobacteria bacterium]MCL5792435.1 DnaJ domain-containing protein [Deltaproteobacteria bacterium]